MSPTEPLLRVLHEDGDLLVVNKPAGLVCHPTKGDAWSSLISRVRLHTGSTEAALVNRLDRETSGVTLVAKSREVAAELGVRFASRSVLKEYEAIVHGWPESDEWVTEAPLGREVASPVAIQDGVRPDGTPASTHCRVVRRFEREGARFTLLRVAPQTGRKHQIRIHLAHAGHAIVGDKIYGGDPTRYLRFVVGGLTEEDRGVLRLQNQALHAVRLALEWRGTAWRFEAEPEPEFTAFLPRLEGPAIAGLRHGDWLP